MKASALMSAHVDRFHACAHSVCYPPVLADPAGFSVCALASGVAEWS